jgi:murein L,D-transpeptidase YafK
MTSCWRCKISVLNVLLRQNKFRCTKSYAKQSPRTTYRNQWTRNMLKVSVSFTAHSVWKIKQKSFHKKKKNIPYSTLYACSQETVTKNSVLIIKANNMHYFPTLFSKELYMFRTDLLSTIRSLNIVFTAIGMSYWLCSLSVRRAA